MRRYRKVEIPSRCHPLVRRLFTEMHAQRVGVLDMAERAGLSPSTLRHWRTYHTPRVDDLEACFNVLGMTLVARHQDGRLAEQERTAGLIVN